MSKCRYVPVLNESGERGFVDLITGQYEKAIKTYILPDCRVLFPAEVARRKRLAEDRRAEEDKKEKAAFLKRTSFPLGNFFFVSTQAHLFDGLSPEATVRLLVLASYLNYDGILIWKQKPMRRRDLSAALNTSKSTVSRFLREVQPRFIEVSDAGLLRFVSAAICRGKIKGREGAYRMRCYEDGLRSLYAETPARKLCYIGYVMQILFAFDQELNMIRENALEKGLSSAPPSEKAFCQLISYSESQRARLLREYKKLRFTVDEGTEPFLSVFRAEDGSTQIFLNPRVIYGGQNWRAVIVSGRFNEDFALKTQQASAEADRSETQENR